MLPLTITTGRNREFSDISIFPRAPGEFIDAAGISRCEDETICEEDFRVESVCARASQGGSLASSSTMLQPPTDQIRRVCAYFDGAEGEARNEELLHFAERRIRRGSWCVRRADLSIPDGRLAEDIVHGVVQAVLAPPDSKGHRSIPDDVDVGVAIRKIIRSCLNHAQLSAENRTRLELPILDDGTDYEGSAPYWSPCEDAMSAEDKAAARARCDEFISLAKKRDKEVYEILVLIRDEGVDKSAEIAKRLHMPVGNVYLARKRLGAMLRKHGLKGGSK